MTKNQVDKKDDEKENKLGDMDDLLAFFNLPATNDVKRNKLNNDALLKPQPKLLPAQSLDPLYFLDERSASPPVNFNLSNNQQNHVNNNSNKVNFLNNNNNDNNSNNKSNSNNSYNNNIPFIHKSFIDDDRIKMDLNNNSIFGNNNNNNKNNDNKNNKNNKNNNQSMENPYDAPVAFSFAFDMNNSVKDMDDNKNTPHLYDNDNLDGREPGAKTPSPRNPFTFNKAPHLSSNPHIPQDGDSKMLKPRPFRKESPKSKPSASKAFQDLESSFDNLPSKKNSSQKEFDALEDPFSSMGSIKPPDPFNNPFLVLSTDTGANENGEDNKLEYNPFANFS